MVWFEKLEDTKPTRTKPWRYAHATIMCGLLPGADFMKARKDVKWIDQCDANGLSEFGINHSSSLKEMVWLLPKSRYTDLPDSADGSVTVSDPGPHWAARAGCGNTSLASFTAQTVASKN